MRFGKLEAEEKDVLRRLEKISDLIMKERYEEADRAAARMFVIS